MREENGEDEEWDENLENHWSNIKPSYKETAEGILGLQKKQQKIWKSSESWKKIEERKAFKK